MPNIFINHSPGVKHSSPGKGTNEMSKAYPQRHFESNDSRHAAKRAVAAAKGVEFRKILYHKIQAANGKVFTDQESYNAALLSVGWTDGLDGMSKALKDVAKALKPDKKEDKKDK